MMAIAAPARRRVRMRPPVVFAWMVMGPMILFFCFFTGVPLVMALIQSLQQGAITAPAHPFVGLGNYQYEISQDPVFWTTVANTLTFTAAFVVLSNLGSLGLALLVGRLTRFAGLFRLIFYLPGVTTIVAVSAVWKIIYDTNSGVLNQILRAVGLPGQDWLGSLHLAMPSVIGMSVWWGIGGAMLIYLAGLQGVDATLYEAARIDGAGAGHLFWHVTLPQLRPMLVFQGVIGVIAGMQVFGQMYVLTQGGPIDATRSIVEYMYDTAFQGSDIGTAAAISFLLFAMVFALVLVQLWLVRGRERA